MRATRRLDAMALACVLLGVAGCSGSDKVSVEMDYPAYDTVTDLTANADIVVLGTVGKKIGSELDNGGNPEVTDEGRPVGTPLSFYSFEVEKVLRGTPETSLTIAWLDKSRLKNDDAISDLTPGQRVVLWLVERTPDQAPGVTTAKDFWVPVSGDNGTMDVAGDHVTARSSALTGLTKKSNSKLRTTIASLSQTTAR